MVETAWQTAAILLVVIVELSVAIFVVMRGAAQQRARNVVVARNTLLSMQAALVRLPLPDYDDDVAALEFRERYRARLERWVNLVESHTLLFPTWMGRRREMSVRPLVTFDDCRETCIEDVVERDVYFLRQWRTSLSDIDKTRCACIVLRALDFAGWADVLGYKGGLVSSPQQFTEVSRRATQVLEDILRSCRFPDGAESGVLVEMRRTNAGPTPEVGLFIKDLSAQSAAVGAIDVDELDGAIVPVSPPVAAVILGLREQIMSHLTASPFAPLILAGHYVPFHSQHCFLRCFYEWSPQGNTVYCMADTDAYLLSPDELERIVHVRDCIRRRFRAAAE